MAKNQGLQDLKSMPDNQEKIELILKVGLAIQVQAIADYLDEEYKLNTYNRKEHKYEQENNLNVC